MTINNAEYKQLFLSEAQEILNASNNALINLEKEPENTAQLHELFRLSHTLKSMAQSMGYEETAKLTHAMESTLAVVRNGQLRTENDLVDLLFKSLDALHGLIEETENGTGKKINVSSLVRKFEEIARQAGSKGKPDLKPAETGDGAQRKSGRSPPTIKGRCGSL